MMRMERGNVKTSPSHVTRGITVQENIIKANERKNIATIMSHRKNVQPMHHVAEQQRLQQVQFVKDAKRQAKKHSLAGKEVKDLNVFVKDKIEKMIKQHDCDMHMMSNFEDLSISTSNKSIQSIICNTSIEGSDNNSCKLAHKK
eukprot:9071455-Ditylum_brightwellii.AAC.1